MGAPKQKWTAAEEAALRAGIAKYGVGKWSTILKDPEFSSVLQSRSNVDLKDKWRNMNVMMNGMGSRQRGRSSNKSAPVIQKNDDNTMDIIPMTENNADIIEVHPLAVATETPQITCLKKPLSRLDNVILEAISELREPRGSSRAAIALYIEERYSAPLNFDKLLVANLKLLMDYGKLIKVKHQYRLAPNSRSFDVVGESSPMLLGGKQKESSEADKSGVRILTKAQVDAELEKMRNMTSEEAAAAAAQAIAEAEAAMAEAEKAAKEAEEAEAEAAQCFAEAAKKALKYRCMARSVISAHAHHLLK